MIYNLLNKYKKYNRRKTRLDDYKKEKILDMLRNVITRARGTGKDETMFFYFKYLLNKVKL